jgi:hypothetical protein
VTIPIFPQYGTNDAAQAAAGSTFLLVWLAIFVVLVIAWWRVFERAGHPGWMAIIPILNLYVLCKVAGKPGWFLLLYLIPIVNIIISFVVAFGVAERFRRGAGFGIGLALLPFIFYPILAFGDNTAVPQAA